MVADVDPGRHDQLLGGIKAIAGQPAIIVADEVAAFRIGRAVVQPTRLQTGAVRERVVAAHVLDQHRVDPRRLVEIPARGEAAVREHLRVHPDRADPCAIRRALRRFGDAGHQIRDGATPG